MHLSDARAILSRFVNGANTRACLQAADPEGFQLAERALRGESSTDPVMVAARQLIERIENLFAAIGLMPAPGLSTAATASGVTLFVRFKTPEQALVFHTFAKTFLNIDSLVDVRRRDVQFLVDESTI